MTYNIQNQVFQKFIEGPKQLNKANSGFQKSNDEQVAYHADLTQGYGLEDDVIESVNDIDIPYYETNERYD